MALLWLWWAINFHYSLFLRYQGHNRNYDVIMAVMLLGWYSNIVVHNVDAGMLTLLMTMSRSLIIICGIIPGLTHIIVGNVMLMLMMLKMLTMLMIAMSRWLIIIDQSSHASIASGTWRGGGRKRKHSRFWTLYFEQNTEQSGSHFTKYLDVLIVIMCFSFQGSLGVNL